MRAARRWGSALIGGYRGTGPPSRVHVRAPPTQNFFAAVINVAYTWLKVDKDALDALALLRKKTGAGGAGEAAAREPALATSPWGMLYADNTGIVSQSPDKLRKMMGMIIVVCAGFGLTVSEAKTEIMCLRTNRMPEPATIFSVETAGQVYNQTK